MRIRLLCTPKLWINLWIVWIIEHMFWPLGVLVIYMIDPQNLDQAKVNL